MQRYTISLDEASLSVIADVLAQAQYRIVAPIILDLQRQIDAQQRAQQWTAAAPAEMSATRADCSH